jgi:hypothetical protein
LTATKVRNDDARRMRIGSVVCRWGLALGTRAAWLLPALAIWPIQSCSLGVDTGRFDDAQCSEGKKACNGHCVDAGTPEFGCGPTDCSPCNIPNGTGKCQNGACVIGKCSDGFSDCNGVTGDGCEVDTNHDPGNCGACGCRCGTGDMQNCAPSQVVTPIIRGNAGCSKQAATGAAQCTVDSCEAGWGDCNADASDGCETDVETVLNCGTCGTGCAAGESCVCFFGVLMPGCTCEIADAGGD